MPTYIFRNKTTGVEWEKDMRMSELDTYKEENNAEIIINSVNLVGGTGENIDAKLMTVGKKHLLKSQRHTHLVNLTNNMVRPVSQT